MIPSHGSFATCESRFGWRNVINPLSRWRERAGVRPKVALWPVDMILTFPLTAAFPASGSRNPYLYIEERERHPVFPDLYKASRPALYKNLNDGMSQCDRAGLYPLPSGRGNLEVLFSEQG